MLFTKHMRLRLLYPKKILFVTMAMLFAVFVSPVSAATGESSLIPVGISEEDTSIKVQDPEQLFDINLELDQTQVRRIEDLVARVVFVSFGRVPTPVDMTFDILDSDKNIIHTEEGHVTVETENVFTKNFSGIELAPGKYYVRLTTLYNVSIEDKFVQSFEVVLGEVGRPFPYWIIFGAIGALLVAIVIVKNRKKQNA